jgi:hypothetical protein
MEHPLAFVNGAWEVHFVRLMNDTLLCVSDHEVARSADMSECSLDRLARECWRINGQIGLPPDSFADMRPEDQEWLRSQHPLVVARVYPACESALPTNPPDLHRLLDRFALNYTPYFVAYCGASTVTRRAADLVKMVRRIDASRANEYGTIFGRACSDVFLPEWLNQLPTTMGDLVHSGTNQMSPELARKVEAWRANIMNEIRRDLYYYGQWVGERTAPLLFGAALAVRDVYGGLYWNVLEQAANALSGREVSGAFDVSV